MSCKVVGCNSNNKNKDSKLRFFSFPKKDLNLKLQWVKACGLEKLPEGSAYVCSKHFNTSDYLIQYQLMNYYPMKGRPLANDAVPSRKLISDRREAARVSIYNASNEKDQIPGILKITAQQTDMDVDIEGDVESEATGKVDKSTSVVLSKETNEHSYCSTIIPMPVTSNSNLESKDGTGWTPVIESIISLPSIPESELCVMRQDVRRRLLLEMAGKSDTGSDKAKKTSQKNCGATVTNDIISDIGVSPAEQHNTVIDKEMFSLKGNLAKTKTTTQLLHPKTSVDNMEKKKKNVKILEKIFDDGKESGKIKFDVRVINNTSNLGVSPAKILKVNSPKKILSKHKENEAKLKETFHLTASQPHLTTGQPQSRVNVPHIPDFGVSNRKVPNVELDEVLLRHKEIRAKETEEKAKSFADLEYQKTVNEIMEEKVKNLNSLLKKKDFEITQLKARNQQYETILNRFFTKAQINRLLHQKQTKWAPEDIADAKFLKSTSPKAYMFLREKGYPMPAPSTLRR